MITFKKYLLEKKDHTKKIRKFANVDLIVDWANSLDKNLALWLARTLVDKTKGTPEVKNSVYKEKFNTYLKGEKNEKIDELVKRVMRSNRDDYIAIVDYVNSVLHENRPNINKLSFDDAFEQAKEFFAEARIIDGILIDGIDEDGCPVLMTYPDDPNEYYWIDLKTTYSEYEAEKMQHCGRTQRGTTLISLREGGRPHVTIAWNENTNVTSQIKGKQNTKPESQFHSYIVDMLIELNAEKHETEHDRSSDFSPDDLSKELYEKLEQGNPDYIENSEQPNEEDLRERYRIKIIDNIEEEIMMYSNVIWNNIDDESFINDHIESEAEYYSEDFNTIDSFISGDAKEELSTWLLENKVDEISNYVLEKYRNDETDDIEEILDNLEVEELIDVFEECGLKDSFCEDLAEERYGDYTAEDVFKDIYGDNALEEKHVRRQVLSYLDEEGFASDIESEMTYEDLLEYFGE